MEFDSMSRATIALLFLVLTWLLPPVVTGHSVHVFAYVENGMIKGEGSLAGGRKVKKWRNQGSTQRQSRTALRFNHR